MNNIIDIINYGRNLEKKVDSNTTQLNDLTNEVTQLTNSNLLINGDLRNPINQRGKTSYTESDYTIDRWILWNSNTSLNVDKGFCTVSGEYCGLMQHLEHPTNYSGQIVTLSARIKSTGNVRMMLKSSEKNTNIINTLNKCEGKYILIQATGTIPLLINDTKKLSVLICADDEDTTYIDIEYIKLEYGSIATLFVPIPIGEELALCQRYYFRNTVWQRQRANTVYLASMDFFIPLSVPMRIVPTIASWSSEFKNLYKLDQSSKVPITSATIYMGSYTNGFQMRCATASNHGLTDGSIELDNTFALDAEIH